LDIVDKLIKSDWVRTSTRSLVCCVCVPALLVFPYQLFAGTALSKAEQGKILDEAVHILGGNANIISRWDDKILFTQIGSDANEALIANRIIKEVTSAIGLDLELILVKRDGKLDGNDYLARVQQSPRFDLSLCPETDSSCANFVVVHTNAETMLALATEIPLRPVYRESLQRSAEIPCFFAPHLITASRIRQVLVYIREDLSTELTETCLQEEIWQSFGLFGDVTGSSYFSFDNRVVPKKITSYDRALLEAVYHPDLGPGAPVFRVLKVFMDALEFDIYATEALNKSPEQYTK